MDHVQQIEAVGVSVLAALCGISPSAVSQWKKDGIPKPWLKFLELARPDVFGNQKQQRSRRQKVSA